MEAIDETIKLLAEQLRGCMEINDGTGALDSAALPAAEWHIDDDGLLTIAPPAGCERAALRKEYGRGEGRGERRGMAPWDSRAGEVKGVLVRPGVVAARDVSWLFADCENLERADVSVLDVSRVEDMRHMFHGCSFLASLDLRGWDVSGVRYMYDMFYGCGDVELVLDGCSEASAARLRELLVYSLPAAKWHIDENGLLVIAPPAGRDRAVLRKEYVRWEGRGVPPWDSRAGVPWDSRAGEVKGVLVRPGVVAARDVSWLFADCENLERADVSVLDVSRVEDMCHMFHGCSSLKSPDLRGWDVSRVEDMYAMFSGCSSLKSLDLHSWDVSRVYDMSDMFSGCSSLRSLDLGGWDLSGAWEMRGMFEGCSSLRFLDLSGWNLSLEEDLRDMFYGCWDVELVLDDCNEWTAAELRSLLS